MSTKKILDEKLLQETLKSCESPAPDEKAKDKAILLALEAFDEEQVIADKKESQEKTQGFIEKDRLKGISEVEPQFNKPFNIWRRIMDKKFILGGMGGAVATCAILIMLGGPVALYKESINTGAMSSDVVLESIDKEVKKVSVEKTLAEEDSSLNQSNSYRNEKSETIAEPKAMDWRNTRALKESRTSTFSDMAFNNTVSNVREQRSRSSAPSVVSGSDGIMMEETAIAPAPPPPYYSAMPLVSTPPYDIMPYNHEIVDNDEFTGFKNNSVKVVTVDPVSTFSIDVDTASYSFMRREINAGNLPNKDSIRVEELINYFNYNYPVPETRVNPFKETIAVYDSPWKQGNKIIHIGIKGHDIDKSEKPKSNLVFLIDTSGSMHSQDKLPLLVNSMKMLVESLEPNDTVGIVTYAGSAGIALEPTKVENKHKIITALENLRSGGSTAGAAGIRTAYELINRNFDKEAVNRVILATDGDFNVGMTSHDKLQEFIENKRKSGAFLSVLGFGKGNYHDNLMQKLAQNGNGNAAYIDTLNEARKVLVDEASGTLFTIAKDVKIQVEFNPRMVSEYRLIGYETRALNREDFNNDAVDAGEIGAGHTVTAIYEITPVGATENRLVDDLRYNTKTIKVDTVPNGGEYAYLKMRYKMPNEDNSKLLSRPITTVDTIKFDELSDDVRFAVAVAGFGQKLRHSKFIGDFSYDNIMSIAKNAKGADEFGYRAEFINLVRLSKVYKP